MVVLTIVPVRTQVVEESSLLFCGGKEKKKVKYLFARVELVNIVLPLEDVIHKKSGVLLQEIV